MFVGPTLAGDSRGTPNPFEELAPPMAARNIQYKLSSSKRLRMVRFLNILIDLLRYRTKYDIICLGIYGGKSFYIEDAASWLGRKIGKPICLQLSGGALPNFEQKHPTWVRRVLSRGKRLTSPSNYLNRYFSNLGYQIDLIPNPVKVENYPFKLRRRAEPRLVWLRAFHDVYNPTDAIQAVSLLRGEFPNIYLTMVGPDKGDGTYQKVIELAWELGVTDNLTITGGVPKAEVPHWLSKGDIFINTTSYESFGISVMEAAACGLCIVTTAVGELPYLWQDGENALLVPSNDPPAIAAAIRRILIEPDLALKLSQGARSKAEKYDLPPILDQWERLFGELVA
jgi:L-malate glycosyltransferase